MRNPRKGQTILEYTVIIVIILGVVIAMKDYVKRGIQGRWKQATDDLSDPYDPQYVNSDINYSTQVNALSTVDVVCGTYSGGPQQESGQWTNRLDQSTSVETKSGFTQVGF